MVKINLSTYHIQLINTKTKYPIKLDKINYPSLTPEEVPKSLIQLLSNFLTENKEEYFSKNNKILNIKDFQINSKNIFYGELLYGTYGTEHPVKNIQDNEDEIKISKNQSVLTPYYFYIELPINTEKGLLILENKSNNGIKGLFEEWLRDYILEHSHTNLRLELKSFIPKKIIDTYLDYGVLKRIRFVSYRLPTDELDILNGYEPEDGYVELKYQINKEKRKQIIQKIKNLIRNKSEESKNYSNIIGNKLETNDIKLEIDLNGSERTFTINNLENAVPARDITDELEDGEDGHRTFESIHNKGMEYANDILRGNFND